MPRRLGFSPQPTRLSERKCTVATEPITLVVAGKGDFVFFSENALCAIYGLCLE